MMGYDKFYLLEKRVVTCLSDKYVYLRFSTEDNSSDGDSSPCLYTRVLFRGWFLVINMNICVFF